MSIPENSSTLAAGQRTFALRRGDAWGGLAAVAVILPQAMAFGVALFSPYGLPASAGALAGLIATASLCLCSGLLGGTMGMVSAPTGPTLVLLAAALSSLSAAGLGGDALLSGLAAVMVLTGLFQIGVGLSGGGKVIKYMPVPVVAGFMTGSAFLMLNSQLRPVVKPLLQGWGAAGHYIPLVAAAVTMAAMHWGPRWLRSVPGTISGLVAGTIAFHAAGALLPGSRPESWLIGTIPGADSLHFGLSLAALKSLPWQSVVVSAAALAVLASLDSLFTAVIADVSSGARHDARRELVGQGLGQILSGSFGGMGGAGTTGASVVAVRSGARRGGAIVSGLTFFALIAVGGRVGELLPISVLAGIILYVALTMIDLDILAWLRSHRTRMEGVIAIIVTAVTVGYDLMVAVGVGVMIAVILFVREQVTAPVVHRRSTGETLHSVVARTEAQRRALAAAADRIIVYELRGNLFFATADRLFADIAADLDRPAFVILQMQRVQQVDLTALRILDQMATRLHGAGGRLIFCEVHAEAGIGHKVRRAVRHTRLNQKAPAIKTCIDLDTALEYAEKHVLRAAGLEVRKRHLRVELADMDLLRSFSKDALQALESVLECRRVAKRETLFEAGDDGDELFLLVDGVVDILLPTTRHHTRRLARYVSGTFFGEVAFIDPGPRTATAVARRKTEYLALSREGFDTLIGTHPKAAACLLLAVGRAQTGYLRADAELLRHLTQF